ncbi:MAG: hypothetical protein M3P51_15000 [Chloroflexota bacterium]|nr:hypothetical protein [Chloroflexota bacterium]
MPRAGAGWQVGVEGSALNAQGEQSCYNREQIVILPGPLVASGEADTKHSQQFPANQHRQRSQRLDVVLARESGERIRGGESSSRLDTKNGSRYW